MALVVVTTAIVSLALLSCQPLETSLVAAALTLYQYHLIVHLGKRHVYADRAIFFRNHLVPNLDFHVPHNLVCKRMILLIYYSVIYFRGHGPS